LCTRRSGKAGAPQQAFGTESFVQASDPRESVLVRIPARRREDTQLGYLRPHVGVTGQGGQFLELGAWVRGFEVDSGQVVNNPTSGSCGSSLQAPKLRVAMKKLKMALSSTASPTGGWIGQASQSSFPL
jgi:hypothetical protein